MIMTEILIVSLKEMKIEDFDRLHERAKILATHLGCSRRKVNMFYQLRFRLGLSGKTTSLSAI